MAGVFVEIDCFTKGRFRYAFRLPSSTNELGQLHFTFEDLENERMANSKECLMDYNTPLSTCDDRIRIRIPTMETLRASFDVATRWAGRGGTPEYAKKWLTANNAKIVAEDTFTDLWNRENLIRVFCRLVKT